MTASEFDIDFMVAIMQRKFNDGFSQWPEKMLPCNLQHVIFVETTFLWSIAFSFVSDDKIDVIQKQVCK